VRNKPAEIEFQAERGQERETVMAGSDKRKQSLYFPKDMLKEIQHEAARQDRSMSWIVQKAWLAARNELKKFPSVNDIYDENDADDPKGRDEEEEEA
jgi:uncharacterized small protein (TIGR04563 family)